MLASNVAVPENSSLSFPNAGSEHTNTSAETMIISSFVQSAPVTRALYVPVWVAVYVVLVAPEIRFPSLYQAIVSPLLSVMLAFKLAEPPESSTSIPNAGAEQLFTTTFWKSQDVYFTIVPDELHKVEYCPKSSLEISVEVNPIVLLGTNPWENDCIWVPPAPTASIL